MAEMIIEEAPLRGQDFTGFKLGMLRIIRYAGVMRRANSSTIKVWECTCDCGKTIMRAISRAIQNNQTCGCSRVNQARERFTTNGFTKTHLRLYRVWARMKQRCGTPTCSDYRNYGARGIAICEKWNTFEGFFEDMGSGYSPGLTIDRKEVNGNYCKDNCRWITNAEQANNKRDTTWITINGRTQTLVDWSKESGVHVETIRNRLKLYGATGEQLISKTSIRRGKRNEFCNERDHHAEYQTWVNIRQHCKRSGLLFCEEWASFDGFLKDMGKRPEGGFFSRKNKREGYYKTNCSWRTSPKPRSCAE